MEAALSVCSCCCVLPWVSPFMTIRVSGAKRGSQTVMFKYKGTKQHTDLCKNHSDATTVPRQMQSLPGQPVPASYLSPHKVPCCNNHLPVPPVFSEASYIASYPQGTAIKEEPSSDAQIKPSAPLSESPAQLSCLISESISSSNCWAVQGWWWPKFTLLPLSLPSLTVLALS